MNMLWYNRVIEVLESNDVSDDDLYILSSGKYYKIGRTKNIVIRIRVFQTACPYNINLVCLIRNKGLAEEIIHTLLSESIFRKNGEWFRNSYYLQKLLTEIDWMDISKPRRSKCNLNQPSP